MVEDEKAFWVAINHVNGLGPKRFRRILDTWGTPREAWNQSKTELKRLLGERVATEFICLKERINPFKMLEEIYMEGINIVLESEEDYPDSLRSIPNPPPLLYYRGELRAEDSVAVSIVGSRTPTVNGLYTAEEIAIALAQHGISVVSGLARGVDSAAHRGALKGGGRTIAVLGSGLKKIYPPENRELAEEIANNGLIMSEYPLEMGPMKGNFPARNRIISGLSLAVLVVEAARDSGSLITASFALEQGREVFAVPGPIQNEACHGSNRLIQQGAYLFQDVGDILGLLQPNRVSDQIAAVKEPELSGSEDKVLALLKNGPLHIDLIIRDSGLPASEVSSLLVVLELKGCVREEAGKLYRRIL
jgi:DNA processing protein